MARCIGTALFVFWSALGAGQNTFSIVHIDSSASAGSGRAIFETPSGYLLFSALNDLETGRTWLYTAHLDQTGAILGTHAFGSSCFMDPGVVDAIASNPDGTFTAAVSHFLSGQRDSLVLFHFNAEGDTISTHFIAAELSLGTRDCVRTVDGNYLLAGWRTFSEDPLEVWPCLTKVTPTGQELWRVATPGYWDHYRTINALADGTFLIGAWRFNHEMDETVIKRVDSAGVTLWTRYIGGSTSYGGGSGHSVVMADGNYLIPGAWMPPDSTSVDEHGYIALYCFTPQGQQLWRHDLYYGRMASATLVRRREDGSMVVPSGYLQEPRDPDSAATLWYLDAEGDTLFRRKYWYFGGYGAWNVASYGMDITSDGGAIFTGLARQGQNGEFPYRRYPWVLKLDEHDCLTPGCHTVGVQEYELALQHELALAPNPARHQLTVTLPLPTGYALQGAAEVVLLDAQGRHVLQRTLPSQGTQLHTTLDLNGLASGLYYLHLRDSQKWLAGGRVVVE